MRNGTSLQDVRVVDLSACADEATDELSRVVCGLLSDAGATVVRLRSAGEDQEQNPRICRARFGHGRWSPADEADLSQLVREADVILSRRAEPFPDAVPDSAVFAVIEEVEFAGPGMPSGAHELIAQALTGAVHEMIPGRAAYIGFRFGTYAAAINLATAVVAALIERLDTGSGRRLEVSLSRGVVASMSLLWSGTGDGTPSAAPVGANIPLFECADGEFVCFSPSPREPRFLTALANALGIDGPPEDLRGTQECNDLLRYYFNVDRLAPAFRRLSSPDVIDRLRRFDVPAEIVKQPGAAWDRPDVAGSGLLAVCPRCGVEYVGSPIAEV